MELKADDHAIGGLFWFRWIRLRLVGRLLAILARKIIDRLLQIALSISLDLLHLIHDSAHEILLRRLLDSPIPKPIVGNAANYKQRKHSRYEAAHRGVDHPKTRGQVLNCPGPQLQRL